MANRIEVGERVVARVSFGLNKKPRYQHGVLRQRPGDKYEPYLVQLDVDKSGIETPCIEIVREKK